MTDNNENNIFDADISQDSANATKPIAVAVIEYWTAMTLASWLKTYFVHQLRA